MLYNSVLLIENSRVPTRHSRVSDRLYCAECAAAGVLRRPGRDDRFRSRERPRAVYLGRGITKLRKRRRDLGGGNAGDKEDGV
jgi:hypothetical protein